VRLIVEIVFFKAFRSSIDVPLLFYCTFIKNTKGSGFALFSHRFDAQLSRKKSKVSPHFLWISESPEGDYSPSHLYFETERIIVFSTAMSKVSKAMGLDFSASSSLPADTVSS
jgi:hypothetical protein